jgi:hypothetical protein
MTYTTMTATKNEEPEQYRQSAVFDGNRIIVRRTVRSITVACDRIRTWLSEDMKRLGMGFYPVEAKIHRRREGSSCSVELHYVVSGSRPRSPKRTDRREHRAHDAQGHTVCFPRV